MTTEMLRAVAERLQIRYQPYANYFGRIELQEHARTYSRGLLLHEGRKSVEPMNLACSPSVIGQPRSQKDVLAMQRFESRCLR